MPTRAALSPSQRAQFTDIPAAIGARELARYDTLSAEEMEVNEHAHVGRVTGIISKL